MHSHGRSELTQILRGSYNDALGLFERRATWQIWTKTWSINR